MTTVTCTLNVARVKISSVEHHSLSKASTAANWSASRVRGTVSVVSYMSNTRTSIFKEFVVFQYWAPKSFFKLHNIFCNEYFVISQSTLLIAHKALYSVHLRVSVNISKCNLVRLFELWHNVIWERPLASAPTFTIFIKVYRYLPVLYYVLNIYTLDFSICIPLS